MSSTCLHPIVSIEECDTIIHNELPEMERMVHCDVSALNRMSRALFLVNEVMGLYGIYAGHEPLSGLLEGSRFRLCCCVNQITQRLIVPT